MPAATNPTRSAPVTHSEVEPTVSAGGSGGGERCPIGATVRCTVRSPETVTYEGEVLAYDPKKVLVLKCPSSSGRSSLFNVHMVNLCLPCEWRVLSERRETVAADPPSLNVTRLHNRQRDQVERKKKQVMAFKAGVSPIGQKVFQAISKTIDDVSWSGENIAVLKEVTIHPPYTPDDVRGEADSKALKHVRKIVEKFIGDQQLPLRTSPAAEATNRSSNHSHGDQRSSSSNSSSSNDATPKQQQGTGGRTPPARSSGGANTRAHGGRELTDHPPPPHHQQQQQQHPKPPFNQ